MSTNSPLKIRFTNFAGTTGSASLKTMGRNSSFASPFFEVGAAASSSPVQPLIAASLVNPGRPSSLTALGSHSPLRLDPAFANNNQEGSVFFYTLLPLYSHTMVLAPLAF